MVTWKSYMTLFTSSADAFGKNRNQTNQYGQPNTRQMIFNSNPQTVESSKRYHLFSEMSKNSWLIIVKPSVLFESGISKKTNKKTNQTIIDSCIKLLAGNYTCDGNSRFGFLSRLRKERLSRGKPAWVSAMLHRSNPCHICLCINWQRCGHSSGSIDARRRIRLWSQQKTLRWAQLVTIASNQQENSPFRRHHHRHRRRSFCFRPVNRVLNRPFHSGNIPQTMGILFSFFFFRYILHNWMAGTKPDGAAVSSHDS